MYTFIYQHYSSIVANRRRSEYQQRSAQSVEHVL